MIVILYKICNNAAFFNKFYVKLVILLKNLDAGANLFNIQRKYQPVFKLGTGVYLKRYEINGIFSI